MSPWCQEISFDPGKSILEPKNTELKCLALMKTEDSPMNRMILRMRGFR